MKKGSRIIKIDIEKDSENQHLLVSKSRRKKGKEVGLKTMLIFRFDLDDKLLSSSFFESIEGMSMFEEDRELLACAKDRKHIVNYN